MPGVPNGLRGLRKEADPINAIFFHPDNVGTIQTSVRYEVHTRTGKVIDRQSDKELVSIMQEVYALGRPDPYGNVLAQVRALNAAVVRKAATEIASAMQFHQWYLNDIARPVPEPQSRGEFVSSKGTRSIRFPHFDSVYGGEDR